MKTLTDCLVIVVQKRLLETTGAEAATTLHIQAKIQRHKHLFLSHQCCRDSNELTNVIDLLLYTQEGLLYIFFMQFRRECKTIEFRGNFIKSSSIIYRNIK